MWKRNFQSTHNNRLAHRRKSRGIRLVELTRLEMLDRRILPAVTATFSAAQGVLTVIGDAQDNTIEVSANAGGTILVNSGDVAIKGGMATATNIKLIQIFGLGGNDNLSLKETNGALAKANIFGGSGNDIITAGSGNDQLFGESGDDTLLGKGGNDQLFGGDGNDVLTSGSGNDQVFGQSGNDRLIWNPGDGNALNEGGAGSDTVEVIGGNGNENFTITANGSRVRFDRVSPFPFNLDIGTAENLVVNASGGNDTITAGNGLANLIQITMDGGAGNDTLNGGDGNDTLNGGDGEDFVDGNRGDDVAWLGAGRDVFQWDPGDGSDVVEGQEGSDTMVFNGANISEKIEISANGNRVRFFRDVAGITMDLDGVEAIDFNALGGADTITVDNHSATDLSQVNLNLNDAAGSGDGQADSVIVNGSDGDDVIQAVVAGNGTSIVVGGQFPNVNITGAEATNDKLTVNALGGNDVVDASNLPAGVIPLKANGGAGNDTILGGGGNDILLGDDDGAGDVDQSDMIAGGPGNDVMLGGAGPDTFTWNPGDGSDTIEGRGGADRLQFNGSNDSERIDISANGGRVRFTRDMGNVTMDLNGIVQINFTAQGGGDNITLNDVSNTDLRIVFLDLAATPGGSVSDGAADTIIVNGTNGSDNVNVASAGNALAVIGLPAFVAVRSTDPTDGLIINGQGGDDHISAAGLPATTAALTINGGDGNDALFGGDGNDFINGGRGNDMVLMGAGDDTFVWDPGDGSDVVEGQSGFDTMRFNGANIDEEINVSATGERVRFFRNVGNITMDLNDVEGIDFNALGGADTITVNDLSGTDLTELNLDLASPPGSGTGDGQSDSVIINGTNGDDAVTIDGDASNVAINGLSAQVNIKGADAAKDRLTVNTLGGDDVLVASGLPAAAILLTANGGEGDDALFGGDGNDLLNGDEGDDVLSGGPGIDILDGGPGDNVLIQD